MKEYEGSTMMQALYISTAVDEKAHRAMFISKAIKPVDLTIIESC